MPLHVANGRRMRPDTVATIGMGAAGWRRQVPSGEAPHDLAS